MYKLLLLTINEGTLSSFFINLHPHCNLLLFPLPKNFLFFNCINEVLYLFKILSLISESLSLRYGRLTGGCQGSLLFRNEEGSSIEY